jgi:hypothetical protein
MYQPPGADGMGARLAEFAWIVKNWVRPLGLHRLGLPCPLMGTGMAFPWAVIERAPLATGNIAEDMQLGVILAMEGKAPVYVPDALVTSTFAASVEGRTTQRTRWEHGHLDNLVHGVHRLIAVAVRRRDPLALALALDLAVPPLALLLMLLVAVSAGTAGWAAVGGAQWPFALAGGALCARRGAYGYLAGRALVRAAKVLDLPRLCDRAADRMGALASRWGVVIRLNRVDRGSHVRGVR